MFNEILGYTENHISRNEICPCYSRKKYKSCHGHFALIQNIINNDVSEMRHRLKQVGFCKPIVSWNSGEKKYVLVCDIIHEANRGTFHDFLLKFYFDTLKRFKINDEKHPMIGLLNETKKARATHNQPGLHSISCTGSTDAGLTLAYNMYLLDHHYPSDFKVIMEGRKNDKQGFSALFYELSVFKFLILSGFKLQFSDEKSGKYGKCCEGIAEDAFGNRFGFEAKSSSASGKGKLFPQDNHKKFETSRVKNLLKDALIKKQTAEFTNVSDTRLIFIETCAFDSEFDNFTKESDKFLRKFEDDMMENINGKSAYIIFTNTPYQNAYQSIKMTKKQYIGYINIPMLDRFEKEDVSIRMGVDAIYSHPHFFKLSDLIKFETIPYKFSENESPITNIDENGRPSTIYGLYKSFIKNGWKPLESDFKNKLGSIDLKFIQKECCINWIECGLILKNDIDKAHNSSKIHKLWEGDKE
jgi:hypothetical protein